MEFRLLGPLEVADEGRVLELGGAKERTLLAVLLLHANETVPTDRLVDDLWGDDPPRSAAKLVATYVWQLRKSVGDMIVTRSPGYMAVVPPDRLDVVRFRQLVGAARELEAEGASATLAEALGLWRGPPLEHLAFASEAARDVEQLEDERLAAQAALVDHELSLGRHGAVLPELRRLVDAHPYHEQLRGQLILALYRSGRQADALAEYRGFRRRCVDELGIEPGPALQELERAMLSHDAAIDPPAAPARRRVRRRRSLYVAGAAAAIVLAAVVALATTRGGEAAVAVGPNAVAVIDPRAGVVVAGVPVGHEPGAIVAGRDRMWVANFADRNVSELDPASRREVGTVSVLGAPTALAWSPRTLWVVSRFDRTITAIGLEFRDPRSTRLPNVLSADLRPRRPTGAAALSGRVRIATNDGAVLDGRGRVAASVALPISDLAATPGTLWAVAAHKRWLPSSATPGLVYRLDSVSGAVEDTTTVGREPNGIAVGLGFVWVVDADDGTLERLDRITGASLERIPLGDPPLGLGPVYDSQDVGGGGGIAVGEGAVWVTDERRNALIRYVPSTGAITRIALDASPADVAVGRGFVWVTLR